MPQLSNSDVSSGLFSFGRRFGDQTAYVALAPDKGTALGVERLARCVRLRHPAGILGALLFLSRRPDKVMTITRAMIAQFLEECGWKLEARDTWRNPRTHLGGYSLLAALQNQWLHAEAADSKKMSRN